MNRLIPSVVVALAIATAGAVPALGVVSQGAFRIGADSAWARGIDGAHTQVAILDPGFGGLAASIAAGELPAREAMETRSFDPVHGLEGRDSLGAPTEHGTRMAEIVHDVAPGARLVLVNYAGTDGFLQAAEWITANGIPVVSHSNSILGGPFDGTGALARAVDRAAAGGVLWVNSAGNFAARHWRGIPAPTGTEIPIEPRAGETLAFGIGWSAPGFEAVLSVQRQQPDGSWAEVTRSDPANRTPPVGVDGGVWRVLVLPTGGGDAVVDVFSRTVGFGTWAVAAGSVATPGDAVGALSVGAVPWRGTAPEPYSSHGPTQDGRAKPDLVGPTYVTANPLFRGIAGTSASTAHVAGAAALIRDERLAAGQPLDPGSLRAELVRRARDLGVAGPDAVTGAGMVRVDTVPPRARMSVPHGARPVVRVHGFDTGTMASVELRLNGRLMRTRPGPFLSQRLWLRKGRNHLEARAVDMAGNEVVIRRVVVW